MERLLPYGWSTEVMLILPRSVMSVDKILVIVNPSAGGGNSEDFIAQLTSDPMFDVRQTHGPGEGRDLAYEAAKSGVEIVAAAGGDGTVHEVVQGLHAAGGSTALAVIPLGTGNDFVRSLGLEDRDRALSAVRNGRTRKLDLIRVTLDGGEPKIAVNAVIIGTGARVSQEMKEDTKSSWGPLSYLRTAADMVGDLEPFDVKLHVDGVTLALEVLNLVVANGPYAGNGLSIAPGADPFDGRLDVAAVRNAPLHQLSRLVPSFLRQEDPEDELFITGGGRIVSLEASRPVPFSIDGKSFTAREAHFEIVAGAMPVRVDSEPEKEKARPEPNEQNEQEDEAEQE